MRTSDITRDTNYVGVYLTRCRQAYRLSGIVFAAPRLVIVKCAILFRQLIL